MHIILEVPKGIHLMCPLIIYEDEIKKNKDHHLNNLVEAKLEALRYSIHDTLKMRKKGDKWLKE